MVFGMSNSLGGYSPSWADDDGAPDPQVRRALGRWTQSGDQSDYLDAVAQLCLSRLLVPLMAADPSQVVGGGGACHGDHADTHHGEEHAGDRRPGDKHAEMSAVLLQHPDGRRAMLGFTGMDSMQSWNARARPVPATLDMLADAAVGSQAGTLLIDLEGPSPLVIDGEVLENLARSRRLVRLNDGAFGWLVRPEGADSVEPAGPESHTGAE